MLLKAYYLGAFLFIQAVLGSRGSRKPGLENKSGKSQFPSSKRPSQPTGSSSSRSRPTWNLSTQPKSSGNQQFNWIACGNFIKASDPARKKLLRDVKNQGSSSSNHVAAKMEFFNKVSPGDLNEAAKEMCPPKSRQLWDLDITSAFENPNEWRHYLEAVCASANSYMGLNPANNYSPILELDYGTYTCDGGPYSDSLLQLGKCVRNLDGNLDDTTQLRVGFAKQNFPKQKETIGKMTFLIAIHNYRENTYEIVTSIRKPITPGL